MVGEQEASGTFGKKEKKARSTLKGKGGWKGREGLKWVEETQGSEKHEKPRQGRKRIPHVTQEADLITIDDKKR